MKNKILMSLIFVLTLVIVDRLLGWGLKKFYFSQKSGEHFAITYALDSIRDNLLIFGTSRATHHYIPSVFEDSLHTTCFNTGKDGEGISYNYALLLGIVNRYSPSCILLDINTVSFYKTGNVRDNLAALLPYADNSHVPIKDLLINRNKFESLRFFSAIYPFNSTLVSSLKGLNGSKLSNLKGYLPLYGQLNNAMSPIIKNGTDNQIDEGKIQDLTNFIDVCASHKVKLCIIQSPAFLSYSDDTVKIILKDLFMRKGVRFFDYSNFLHDPKYFSDVAHLNAKGAMLFSQMLTASIKDSDM